MTCGDGGPEQAEGGRGPLLPRTRGAAAPGAMQVQGAGGGVHGKQPSNQHTQRT